MSELARIPEGCLVEGMLAENLTPEQRSGMRQAFSADEPITDADQLQAIGEQYNIDSLDFIEAETAVEDCNHCEKGLGSAACRLADAVLLIG